MPNDLRASPQAEIPLRDFSGSNPAAKSRKKYIIPVRVYLLVYLEVLDSKGDQMKLIVGVVVLVCSFATFAQVKMTGEQARAEILNFLAISEEVDSLEGENCTVEIMNSQNYFYVEVNDPQADDYYGLSLYKKGEYEVVKTQSTLEVIDVHYDGDEANGEYSITETIKITKADGKVEIEGTFYNDVLSDDVESGSCLLK